MDPYYLLNDQQERARRSLQTARSGGITPELDSYLDIEERIIYPMLDRCGPAGLDAMAEGQARHDTLLEIAAAHPHSNHRLLGALEAHVDLTHQQVYPALETLGPDGLDDLGDALVEALASREEADAPLSAPFVRPDDDR